MMIKTFHTPLIAFVLILLAIGCKHTPDERLLRTELLMVDYPDSAFNIIKDIKDTFPDSEYDRNVYRVLLTEARYKNWIDEESDSLINIATKYFDPFVSDPYRMKAYLYQGIILSNSKHYVEALASLVKASQTSGTTKTSKTLPFINRAFGDVFTHINNHKTAVEYYKKSLEEFKKLNMDSYIPGAVYDVCKAYSNAGVLDSAFYFAKETYTLAQEYNDSALIILSMFIQGSVLRESGHPYEAKDILERCIDKVPNNVKNDAIQSLGVAYLEIGDMAKAKEMEELLQKQAPSRKILSCMIAEKEGDYKRAFYSYKDFSDNNFNIFSDWVKNRGEGLLLKNLELERENSRLDSERNHSYIIALVLAVISLLSVCFMIILYLRNAKLKQRQDLQTIVDLQNDLCGKEEIINDIRQKHETFLSEKNKVIDSIREGLKESMKTEYNIIDKIAKEYYEIETIDNAQYKKILKMVNSIIRDMKNTSYVKSNLCKIVNARLDGLLDRLRADYPEITDEDITLFTFTILRFSGKSIGLFMGITDNNVYARKRLLRLKLEKRGIETAEPYLSWF